MAHNISLCQNSCLIFGVLLIGWGVLTLFYKPYDMFMDQRIQMTPGLPPYEWWFDPPEEVILKIYLFNVTNSEEFLNGTDSKLKLDEVGPVIYREKLTHSNPIFNENGTFTYTANRTAIYLPELNTIDLNSTIVMPNLGVLLIPGFLYDASVFTKIGVNLMMSSLNSHPFIKTTIHNYLWNITDPLLDFAQTLAPNLVPTKNVGILNKIYSEMEDNVTVYIGTKFGHRKFFLIDKYDGTDNLPHFNGDKCGDKVTNSSEGVSYPQFLTRNDTLKYWRKTLCKVGNLYYSRDVKLYGVDAFRYDLTPSTFDRTNPSYDDCYKGTPALPNGLSDAAPCYFGVPLAASFPHFLHGDDVIRTYVEGMKPDMEKHSSFVIVEPNTGIPLHGIARSQSNLVMNNMRGFNDKIKKFSDITIPLTWFEYNQVGIPWYIEWLIYFVVVLVPILQYLFIACLFFVGICLVIIYFRARSRSKSHLVENKTLAFETEVFLKP
ncbi:scavenger receptor class B member 1-like isoform X2 [Anoplophora glabripennis]|uniref:scavenger receptor class B member 1-like isoform X2 n=1 Tax=Anoplophora glabripennis TaxID=217634 RepID=UPI000874E02E|nr:scavenger receptor class B member 1-like isoform X2 [Anoplophora glabripennis]